MPRLTVTVKGIDSEVDAKGKEYMRFVFGLSIGNERIHTIAGRYSELREKYAELPGLLRDPTCDSSIKFPPRHVSMMGYVYAHAIIAPAAPLLARSSTSRWLARLNLSD